LQGQCRPHNEKFRAGERRQEDCFGRGSNTRLLKNTFSNYNNFTADEVNLNEMELSLSLHFPLPWQTLFHKYLSRAKMTPLHDSRPNRHATHEILQKTMKITEEHFHSDAGETPAPTHHLHLHLLLIAIIFLPRSRPSGGTLFRNLLVTLITDPHASPDRQPTAPPLGTSPPLTKHLSQSLTLARPKPLTK